MQTLFTSASLPPGRSVRRQYFWRAGSAQAGGLQMIALQEGSGQRLLYPAFDGNGNVVSLVDAHDGSAQIAILNGRTYDVSGQFSLAGGGSWADFNGGQLGFGHDGNMYAVDGSANRTNEVLLSGRSTGQEQRINSTTQDKSRQLAENNGMAQERQQASAQSDPVNFEGAITYRKGALLLSHGRFSGYVISDTNPPQLIYVEGYLNGIGFQVGVISGEAPVRFAAPSVEALSGSNQGGLFQAELSFGAGPATAVGGEGTLGAFPNRQGGHSFTGSASGQFMEVSPVVSAFDLLERPKFGAGFGASFTGITVREARVVRIISPDE